MKAIIKISQATFGKFKLLAITEAKNDYYNQPHTRSYGTYSQHEARFSNQEKDFIERIKEIKNTSFPFNLYVEARNHTWGKNVDKNAINLGDDWCIYCRWGYHIDHEAQCYAYSTCAGNFWG